MSTRVGIGSGLIAAALAASSASAADLAAPAPVVAVAPAPASVPVDLAFGVRVQSDYIFRGISQSNRRASPQAYGELQLFDNFFYAGVAGYRVDLPTKPQAEVDLTVGIRPKFGPLTFDLGLIYYYYPGERRLINPFTTVEYSYLGETLFEAAPYFTPRNTDFLELAGKVSWAIDDRWTVGGGVFYAKDWLGSGATGTFVNGTVKYAFADGAIGGIPGVFAISGELGHYYLGRTSPQLGSLKLEDYTTWNAGLSYTYKSATLDLRYHDTNLDKRECYINTTDPRGLFTGSSQSKWCSSAFVATLSFDFTATGLGLIK